MDVILIIDGRAHEVWRAASLDEMTNTVNERDIWSSETQTFSSPE